MGELRARSGGRDVFDCINVHQGTFLDWIHDYVRVRATEYCASAGVNGVTIDFDELFMREHATVGELVGEDGLAESLICEDGAEVVSSDNRLYAIAGYYGRGRCGGAIVEAEREFTCRWVF